jgi:integrase
MPGAFIAAGGLVGGRAGDGNGRTFKLLTTLVQVIVECPRKPCKIDDVRLPFSCEFLFPPHCNRESEQPMAKRKASTRKARRDPDQVDPLLHLDEDQVEQLRKAAAKLGRNGHRDQTMVLLAFHHGFRVSELVRLRWERVYLNKEEMYVTRCKGSKSGMHMLFPDDIAALKKLGPDRTGYVFKSESKQEPGPVSESGFFRIVQRAGKAAGLGSRCHPHQLRHACGYWMHKEGFDILEIQAWLGHRNIANTEHYTALDTTAIKDKWKRLRKEA